MLIEKIESDILRAVSVNNTPPQRKWKPKTDTIFIFLSLIGVAPK